MYTAAILERNSQLLLQYAVNAVFPDLLGKDLIMRTTRGQELPHHMTVNMGKMDENLNPDLVLGSNCKLYTREVVYNLQMGVCAVKVRKAVAVNADGSVSCEFESKNVMPHITFALKHGVPPKASNAMLESSSEHNVTLQLEEELALDGYIQECP